ncbi:prolyl oligopeptidase family serine peptidase [Mucilaginibacter aquariorum]|uniref:Prolyl oligopeptidase family serine peptidase n=1 Tax=Mucilaginibacter aquariorum TaxID=2967225 RepID=A0ABT1T528_9SPHI|nr:prolyl oligopeptidase family serine peptidase [Mucilaginibacter aquariorum]MCQ6959729.1 prolyl oligopeptidase family serine peptidase [Mucilaginibacter aquariorum]
MTIKKLRILIMLGTMYLAFPFLAQAQTNSSFDRGSFIMKTDTLPYRILFPKKFDPQKKYPLIIVLHGAGERGNDNEAQIKYGPKLFLNDTIRQNYPAIVVFPQCPKDDFWPNVKIDQNLITRKTIFNFQEGGKPTCAMNLLLGLVDQMLDKPFISKKQVYIGGLSMGGMGTLEMLRRKPNTFAAAFSICGGDNTNNVKKYAKKIPLWFFHGAKDSVVPFEHSQVVVDALKAAGADPKFTIYPKDDHNSWDDAFAEPQLIPWLFSHSK